MFGTFASKTPWNCVLYFTDVSSAKWKQNCAGLEAIAGMEQFLKQECGYRIGVSAHLFHHQDKMSNYDNTDLFVPIFRAIENLYGWM